MVRLVATLMFALALAGCDRPRAPAVASPLASCPASLTDGSPLSSRTGQALPDVTLPCFTGGAPVRLARLGRPAVINLWGSYCQPCRTELPELQRFADTAPGVVVLGVVTADERAAAASLAQDLGLTFPAVEDRGSRLMNALGRSTLPLTLFVDGDGTVRHEEVSGALTRDAVANLVSKYLDVAS